MVDVQRGSQMTDRLTFRAPSYTFGGSTGSVILPMIQIAGTVKELCYRPVCTKACIKCGLEDAGRICGACESEIKRIYATHLKACLEKFVGSGYCLHCVECKTSRHPRDLVGTCNTMYGKATKCLKCTRDGAIGEPTALASTRNFWELVNQMRGPKQVCVIIIFYCYMRVCELALVFTPPPSSFFYNFRAVP